MPRGRRDDAPGVAHHIMARGIERRPIFFDDADRGDLLRRLSILGPELGFRCFGWALMPNHFHLVVRSGETSVSRLMARLGTGYARYFNERHDRVGHLFQNRFRSRRVIDDVDLIGVVLYVCRNPLAGGLVADPLGLEHFPWCSAGALTGSRSPHSFEAIDETLALFDRDRVLAQRRLRGWLELPAETPHEGRERPTEAPPVVRTAVSGEDLGGMVRELCRHFGVTAAELRSRRRGARIAAARSALVSRASRELGLSGSQLARILGVTPSAVSRMRSRAGATSQLVKERPR